MLLTENEEPSGKATYRFCLDRTWLGANSWPFTLWPSCWTLVVPLPQSAAHGWLSGMRLCAPIIGTVLFPAAGNHRKLSVHSTGAIKQLPLNTMPATISHAKEGVKVNHWPDKGFIVWRWWRDEGWCSIVYTQQSLNTSTHTHTLSQRCDFPNYTHSYLERKTLFDTKQNTLEDSKTHAKIDLRVVLRTLARDRVLW